MGACTEPIEVPWLLEGNFWLVSWMEVEHDVGLFESTGSVDGGSYSMKLGEPTVVQGFSMYPLVLSGDTHQYIPLWEFIGTDGCGNILASRGGTPVPIYSLTSDEWTGRGFWSTFEGYEGVRVDRDASIIPSQYTERVDAFAPPITAVGYSSSQGGVGAGTGCEYFAGYGTICGGSGSGISRQTLAFEYWDEEAGPIAMHYSYDYDSGGSLSTERHTEQRVEVWFFGDTSDDSAAFESEPDSYVEPTPLPIRDGIFTMHGEINRQDFPAGAVSGTSAVVDAMLYAEIQDWYEFEPEYGQQVAERVHDWYAFTIDNPEERVELYLAWGNAEHDLNLHWFAAPGHPDLGFLYLGEDYLDVEDFHEFNRVKGIPNPATPGPYLLGVERTTETQATTRYAIMVLK